MSDDFTNEQGIRRTRKYRGSLVPSETEVWKRAGSIPLQKDVGTLGVKFFVFQSRRKKGNRRDSGAECEAGSGSMTHELRELNLEMDSESIYNQHELGHEGHTVTWKRPGDTATTSRTGLFVG